MLADDTNMSIPGRTVTDLQLLINSDLANLNCWLRANKLSFNVAKTQFMIIGSCQKKSDNETFVELENHRIERVDQTRSLGLTIDTI